MATNAPFKNVKTSSEIIRLAVMMYVRFPLSPKNVEDLLHERGIDVRHESVRFWWNRLGAEFASESRRSRIVHASAETRLKPHSYNGDHKARW